MLVVNKEVVLPFSAKVLFDVVSDIESYPKFLPWCLSTKVLERSLHQVKASMTVGKSGIVRTLTTQNTSTEYKQIRMQQVEGPFSFFEGVWDFQPLQEETKVKLTLSFDFKDLITSLALRGLIDFITNKVVLAFCNRVYYLYENQE